jgi:hypothetical protein
MSVRMFNYHLDKCKLIEENKEYIESIVKKMPFEFRKFHVVNITNIGEVQVGFDVNAFKAYILDNSLKFKSSEESVNYIKYWNKKLNSYLYD